MSPSRHSRSEAGPVSLRFLGATNTGTGSKFLLDSGAHRELVDCGLFQGYKQSPSSARAWKKFVAIGASP